MRIDLHTHSRVSDGTDSPDELVRAAQAAGLDVVALTDHDTADGWDEAAATAHELGIELVRGMEISTTHEGRSVHLLGYLPDPTYPPLADELRHVLDGRRSRLPAMVERLRGLGIDLTVDDVLAVSADAAASGRPHVADALVRKGVVADRDEAFDTLLAAGRPAYVGRYATPLDRAIRLVSAAGGVSVIAHVWGRSRSESPGETELAALQEVGLTGIEVDHQDHDPDRRERLRAIARDLGLVATGSSDYHGAGKTLHDLGINTTAPEEYERLLDAAAAASAASGRSTPQVVA
ncbi:PHP domain-containing protein [Nocardioides sp. AN3]